MRTILLTLMFLLVVIAGCAAPSDEDETASESADAIRGNFPVGTRLQTNDDVNQRDEPSRGSKVLQVIPQGTIVLSGAAASRAGWYGVSWNGQTGWVDGQYLSKPTAASGQGDGALIAYHNAGQLTLWDQTFGRRDGADPLSNIRDAAAGRSARTSCYGGAPCGPVQLSSRLVSGMVALRQRHGYSYFVTSIAGASHSAGSYHYAGRAFDLDTINGVKVNGDSALARGFMSACTSLGAIEVLGPSNRSDHQDHIHCAW